MFWVCRWKVAIQNKMFRFSDRMKITISHLHSHYKFYQVISFRSSSATSTFSEQTQIFRERYLMGKIAVFSAFQIGLAYKNSHSRVMGCFCKDHSCINTTDPLTGRRELKCADMWQWLERGVGSRDRRNFIKL